MQIAPEQRLMHTVKRACCKMYNVHVCTHDFLQKPVNIDDGIADFLQKISSCQVV